MGSLQTAEFGNFKITLGEINSGDPGTNLSSSEHVFLYYLMCLVAFGYLVVKYDELLLVLFAQIIWLG